MNIAARLILLLLLMSPTWLSGQGIAIDLVNDSTLITDPGKLITIPYKISNKHRVSVRLSPFLELPEEWKETTQFKRMVLLPGEEQTVLFSFIVPRNCIAGNYNIVFSLNNENGEKYVKNVNIYVNPVSRIELSEAASDSYVRAGLPVNSRFMLTNKSNFSQYIQLESSGTIIGPDQVILMPDSSKIIQVRTSTSPEQINSEQKGIRLTAKAADSAKTTATQFHRVLVISTEKPRKDKFQRYDVKASLTYLARVLGEDVSTGFQGELSGIGFIDSKEKHLLEFRMRGPDRVNFSVLGQHEEYYVKYTNPGVQISLGDQNYSLTPLTENSRYGRGGRIEWKQKMVETGVFYNKPRFSPGLSDVFGANLNLVFAPRKKAGIYYLNKSLDNDPEKASILSLATGMQFGENTHIYAEVSKGWKGEHSGNGGHLSVDTRNDRLYFSSFIIYADKNYPGYYTNTTTLGANASYRVYKSWNIYANAWQDDKNTTRDTLFGISPYRLDYRLGFGTTVGREGYFRAYAAHTLSQDRADISLFHYDKNYFRLEFNQLFKNAFYVNVSGDYGKTRNLLISEPEIPEANGFKIQTNLAYTPSRKVRAGAFVAFERDIKYSQELESSWYYGLDLNAWIGKGTFVNFRVQNNYSLEEYYRNRSLFDFRLTQRFFKNHEISLMGQYALLRQSNEKTDLSYGVTYSVDLGIPVRKTKEPGQTISGTILNQGVESVAGVTLLLNGYVAKTDKNGYFEFRNVKPGSYMLALDNRSVGFGDISDIQLPIKLFIEAGSDKNISIGLTKSCSVKGKFKFAPSPNKNESIGLLTSIEPANHPKTSSIIVEAKSDNEIIRILSDESGIFEFTYLRPGNWTFKIYENGLSRDHELQQSDFQFNLKPGDHIEFEVEIKAKQRSIRFVDPPVMQTISMKK